jgi:hypothetical protein
MPTAFLRCDKCQTILAGPMVNTPAPVACPKCRAPILARVFPAFFRPEPAGHHAETVVSDEEASCFFHPRKKAVASCADCGRFLCALCDLELGGRHICPSCLESGGAGKTKQGFGELESQKFLHDQLALMVGGLPLMLLWGVWPLFFFTGPAALYLVVRYWGEPSRSLIPRTQTRMVFAAIFGLLQLAAGASMIYFVWFARTRFSLH